MFSIGIPAYKGVHLKECIESILTQTIQDFELIIVNDCSPDPIDDIVLSFKDDRIQYYKNEKNYGSLHVVDNWNKCLSYAKGEFFVLMGDDDKMQPDYLSEFLNLIDSYPELDVFHCRSLIINNLSEPISITPISPNYEDIYDYMTNSLIGFRTQFVSDFVYRTSPLKTNGGYYKLPLAWASDYLTSFIIAETNGIAHTDKPVFCYRSHPTSITSKGNLEIKSEATSIYYDWVKDFLKTKPQDKLLLLKHQVLEEGLRTAIASEKQNIIRSQIGKTSLFLGLIKCYKLRHKFNLTINDLIGSIGASFLNRSLNKK